MMWEEHCEGVVLASQQLWSVCTLALCVCVCVDIEQPTTHSMCV